MSTTKIHSHHYSEVCINLLISRLELMKSYGTTIKEFNEMLKQVDRLHQIQIESIAIEDDLEIETWNGDYSIVHDFSKDKH